MSHLCCAECGVLLSEAGAYTYQMKSGKKEVPKFRTERTCIPCKNFHGRVRTRIMRVHPPPPAGSECTACRRVDKLFCDHDHAVAKAVEAEGKEDYERSFNGYICQRCNTSIGLAGDSEKGVQQLLTYLQKANERRNASKIGAAVGFLPFILQHTVS